MNPSASFAMPRPDATAAAEFEALLAAHRGILVRIAAGYAFTRPDRDDLAQEIALQLWRAFPAYDRARPFSTWMYRVALNVALSHRRRAHGRGEELPLDADGLDAVGARDVDAETRERLALVQRALRAFAPLDRALLLLHLDGLSHAAIGEVLGISESNAATRLGRIRQQLRRLDAAGAS